MNKLSEKTDFLVIGGGAAGCTLAARLSEDPKVQVVLIEAGPDVSESSMSDAIRSAYPSRAFFTREYFYPEMYGRFGDVPSPSGRKRAPARYEQARVLGGGSTINGLVGNRGAPADYDEWKALGAEGWGWDDVLPYFRKLERDLDFDGPFHGKDGPIPVQRLRREDTSGFVQKSFEVLRNRGYPEIADQNAQWQDGIMPAAITVNERGERAGTATSYLTPAVRSRANFQLITDTEVTRLLFEDSKVVGVEARRHDALHIWHAEQTIVSCGAIHTPVLLMRNGIGDAKDLGARGIEVIKDLPGVGRNLHEHPALGISAFVRDGHRHTHDNRHHTQAHLRFSSGHADCPPSDMKVAILARSAWHAVGAQLATFYLWINKPYSKGTVQLDADDPLKAPLIDFHLLSDPRDLARMRDAFRLVADIARDPGYDAVRHEVFPTIYSDRVRKVSRPTRWNAFQTAVLAKVLDLAGFARGRLIRELIAPVDIESLLDDDQVLDDYLHKAVVGVWHPVGTCKMGRDDDPLAVTDAAGHVRGVSGLRICDASLMPAAVCANTNLPTIMMAERMVDLIKQGR